MCYFEWECSSNCVLGDFSFFLNNLQITEFTDNLVFVKISQGNFAYALCYQLLRRFTSHLSWYPKCLYILYIHWITAELLLQSLIKETAIAFCTEQDFIMHEWLVNLLLRMLVTGSRLPGQHHVLLYKLLWHSMSTWKVATWEATQTHRVDGTSYTHSSKPHWFIALKGDVT